MAFDWSEFLKVAKEHKLKRLRLYRNQADYTDRFPGLVGIAPKALELCEQVIEGLKKL